VLVGAAQGAEQVASQGGNHTAAWLAFVGAIIVATIAAGTAQWRLRTQLNHDRHLRDLDELRTFLDECSRAVSTATEALARVLSQAPFVPRSRWWRPWSNAEEKVMVERLTTFWEANELISPLYQQLVLRVGVEHDLAKAFLAVHAALTTKPIELSAAVGATERGSDDRAEALDEVMSSVREAHYGFLESARRSVGVDLP
jgi:hypothetical protein